MGVRFVPIRFTPISSKYVDQECGGVNIIVTHREAFQPLRTGLTLALTLRRLYPDDWDTKSLNRLLSSEKTREGILAGKSVDQLQAAYKQELDSFKQRRKKYLLYQ